MIRHFILFIPNKIKERQRERGKKSEVAFYKIVIKSDDQKQFLCHSSTVILWISSLSQLAQRGNLFIVFLLINNIYKTILKRILSMLAEPTIEKKINI